MNWARVESACQWLMWRTTLASTSSMALRRVWEVEGLEAVYGAAEAGVDFPDGLSSARIAVAQWGEAFGWGAEAVVGL